MKKDNADIKLVSDADIVLQVQALSTGMDKAWASLHEMGAERNKEIDYIEKIAAQLNKLTLDHNAFKEQAAESFRNLVMEVATDTGRRIDEATTIHNEAIDQVNALTLRMVALERENVELRAQAQVAFEHLGRIENALEGK